MGWKSLVFGNEWPSRTRVVLCLAFYVLLGLALHGWVVRFVPAPWLSGVQGLVIAGVVGLVASLSLMLQIPAPTRAADRTGRRILTGLVLAPVVGMLFWLAGAKALPHIVAGVVGEPDIQAATLRTSYKYSRRACDYRAEMALFAGGLPGHLCISKEFYRAHPDQDVQVDFHGRRTMWGFRIERMEVVQERR